MKMIGMMMKMIGMMIMSELSEDSKIDYPILNYRIKRTETYLSIIVILLLSIVFNQLSTEHSPLWILLSLVLERVLHFLSVVGFYKP